MGHGSVYNKSMKLFKHLAVILIAIFSVNMAWAQSYSTQMTPVTSEMLNDPIALSGICSEVEVVEWRDSGHKATQPTRSNIMALKRYCKEVMSAFPEFVKSRGFNIKKAGKLHTSVCFMPMDSSPRNLNDTNYRFSSRSKSYDSNGEIHQIWGYFQRYTNYIYVRNTGASYHKVVFIHELFHSASYYYGIYNQHTGHKDLRDENLAREFTIYLGYGE
ncbi:hypothetical protein LCGC14_0459250 [marine sediment metagenome]|uniref:Uncharacterized protein n=1 Tax=marine sediment metagenome TaxID=412755 RepID=A0A0F9V2C5_9ZZZZ